MTPNFFTGRHSFAIFLLIMVYPAFVLMTISTAYADAFLGSEYIRTLHIPEVLGVLLVVMVGSLLCPKMRFVEQHDSVRFRAWYGVSAFLTCLLPLLGNLSFGLASRFHLPPFNAPNIAGPEELMPRAMLPATFNAIIIGAIALIFVHYLGVLGGLGSIVVVYPILMYLSVSPIASFVPYAATGPAYHPTPRVAWACVFVLAATLVWSFDRNGKLGWLRCKN